jgi:hypothetical protein
MWLSDEGQRWLQRRWIGEACQLSERADYLDAAREWADHPDFAPPRYGYGNPADAAIRQAIGYGLEARL